MKKIILLILTTFIGLLVFSFDANALNSDATATCVYTIPNDKYFVNITFEYKNNDINYKCSMKDSTNVLSPYINLCEVNEIYNYSFVDKKADKVYCPVLYYSYTLTSYGYDGGGTTQNKYVISSKNPGSNSSYNASSGKLTLSSSKINEGKNQMTDEDKTKYLQCTCGDILIKQGSIIFNNSYGGLQISGDWKNFNLNNFDECPEAVYYKYGLTQIKVSDVEFKNSQTLACATTEDAAGWNGSSGNDTDYKPQEDKIGSFCSETAGAWKVFGYLVMALKILIPVIIIVMGSLDLGKAVVANSEDEMKKATQVLVKRIIAGIVIFFIPTIVNLVLKLASNYVSVVDSGSSCIECVSKPGSC